MKSLKLFTFSSYVIALAGIMLLFSSCQQEDPTRACIHKNIRILSHFHSGWC
jgi:hypothetical protein